VTFEFNTDPTFIANCHCLDCKKASGGEMATAWIGFGPECGEPKLEMFAKRRLKWAKPLDLPQFDGMPG
jgi:hypothetical protein